MGWPFCVSALPHSLGVGYGYASFFRLSGAIKNSHPLFAFTHSFRIFGTNSRILWDKNSPQGKSPICASAQRRNKGIRFRMPFDELELSPSLPPYFSFQINSLYWAMVRSVEKKPDCAVLVMAFFSHRPRSW